MAKQTSEAASKAISLKMTAFQNMALAMPAHQTIMVRGRHGIGKSESVYQIATKLRSESYRDIGFCRRVSNALRGDSSFVRIIRDFWQANDSDDRYQAYPRDMWHYDMGLPVVERRLSQNSEGDMLGLPVMLNGERQSRGATFTGADWYLACCDFPCVLFLDELNRANQQVRQGTFQIGDSRSYYGNRLHDETRVFTAVNNGSQYQVDQMDPAEVSRWAIIELDPDVKEWIAWAKNVVHPALTEFIFSNEQALEMADKTIVHPDSKTPDRRAWVRVDKALRHAGLYDQPENPTTLHVISALVGQTHGIAFYEFLKNRKSDISADEILTNWEKVQLRLPNEEASKHAKMIELCEKLATNAARHAKEKKAWTDDQIENFVQFMESCPSEVRYNCWSGVCKANSSMLLRLSQTRAPSLLTNTIQGPAANANLTPKKRTR